MSSRNSQAFVLEYTYLISSTTETITLTITITINYHPPLQKKNPLSFTKLSKHITARIRNEQRTKNIIPKITPPDMKNSASNHEDTSSDEQLPQFSKWRHDVAISDLYVKAKLNLTIIYFLRMGFLDVEDKLHISPPLILNAR
ncbi:hypothetical protein OCU04_005539 [Sclerotinia nivalis]|uniref:Uncharacterized protein n=1 Tax=Sclerotinia nivalis TaxID=352851 RepID=A0A9X0APC2_9HELO|nr:hypothetical protein OCU04_005539 [Sclerotinia nivalis]